MAMNATTDELLMILGGKEVEIQLLKRDAVIKEKQYKSEKETMAETIAVFGKEIESLKEQLATSQATGN